MRYTSITDNVYDGSSPHDRTFAGCRSELPGVTIARMINGLSRLRNAIYSWRPALLMVVLFGALCLTFSDQVRGIYAQAMYTDAAAALSTPVDSPLPTITPSKQHTVTPPAPPSSSRSPLLSPSLLGRNLRLLRPSETPQAITKSPLVTPEIVPDYPPVEETETNYGVVLPTVTPTPYHPAPTAAAETIPTTAVVSETLAATSTAAITELLDVPVVKVSLPEAEAAPVPVKPPSLAPDGVSRIARVPILMYHYLSVPPAGADIYRLDLSVTPDLFAQHLDAIQDAGYTTITLYELVDHLTSGAPLPDKPVLLTFDDGYVDNYRNALPLLRERKMTATFFVVTDFMDEERPEYINWDMAREMRDAGMKIESHGRNHVSLQGKDYDYLVWQALGSLETIEYELGVRPRFVSYPAGQYDAATKTVFESAGYWAGVTTIQGATHSSDELFDLRRVRVRGTTTADELLRLLALDW